MGNSTMFGGQPHVNCMAEERISKVLVFSSVETPDQYCSAAGLPKMQFAFLRSVHQSQPSNPLVGWSVNSYRIM